MVFHGFDQFVAQYHAVGGTTPNFKLEANQAPPQTINLVRDDALTYKNRHALRMRQTTPSILPFDLVARIIKEADGGRSTHQKRMAYVLLDLEQMRGPPGCIGGGWRDWSALRDGAQCLPNDCWDFEGPWPKRTALTKAAIQMLDRNPDELEVEACQWWSHGGGGYPYFAQTPNTEAFDLAFQSWKFPGKRSIMGVPE